MRLVVVESPAKARTVRKLLGAGYRVLACYGHVSDLPAKAGSVKPDEGFAMVYETGGRRAARALGAIRGALAEADGLVLATDPDREGEAIAWQVLSWLREKDALGDKPVERVAFHEITAPAVRAAMARPRGLDMDLVRAQQARRALDYLVGYGLSPLLWRKAPGCRSAGRVQSVALRLVCAREAEIEAFVPREYWTVEAAVATAAGVRFAARLSGLDGAAVDGCGMAARELAQAAARRIRDGAFEAVSVERRTVRRRPAPPFTTATLQQEAARRFGFGVGYTMRIAQDLYEGIDLEGGRAGLITYMRTDTVSVPKAAVDEARRTVRREHGGEYLSRAPRVFRSRAVNVHEAHEAIRPTEVARTPESLAGAVAPDAVRLYALIRDRMLASQMAAARSEKLEIVLATPGGEVALAAAGARLVFDGFLRVFGAGDREFAEDGTPPALDPGERVRIEEVRVARRVTAAPPRYTEAGLVGRLEALGIGRPSTWAVIVGVLRERGYAAIEDGRFAPLERGRVATAFLEGFFGRWVEYGFTASMEAELDRIAAGEAAWKSVLGGFWGEFRAALERTGELDRATVLAAVEERLAGYIHGAGAEPARRRCPACGAGVLLVKASRHGPFVGCGAWPACGYRRPLASGSGAAGEAGPKRLGTDPASGLAVTLRRGPHGHYLQLGDAGEAKPRRVSVPGDMDPDGIGLDTAFALLALPREVGVHPGSGQPILAGIGRFGPWVRHGATYAAIPDGEDVLTVGINRAVALLADREIRDSRAKGPKRVLRELGPHPGDGAPVWLKTGHYGPFVAHRRTYAAVPEDIAPDALTLERALALLDGVPGRRG